MGNKLTGTVRIEVTDEGGQVLRTLEMTLEGDFAIHRCAAFVEGTHIS